MTKKQVLLLVAIMLIAVFFRFYLIGKMPGGLFPDMAANGLDINNINKGHLQPFFPRGNGREALFFYLEDLSTKIFGVGVWQFSITSAAMGVLAVFACFLLAKRLYDTNTALVASFLMAVGTWHIVLSRTAFRATTIPFFTAMLFYFIVRAVQAKTSRDQLWSAAFAGLFFSLGFYTYIAYRIIVVVLGLLIAVLLAADRKQGYLWTKKYRKAFAVMAITAFVVFIPLGLYFAKNPSAFVGRAGQVSVFNKDLNHGHLLATIVDVSYKSLRAFFVDGDLNWRQNISGDPFLSPLVSPFFGIALIVLTILVLRFMYEALKNKQKMSDLKHFVPIYLFWGMLIPVISTAEGIPHGLRSVGMIPSCYIIAAVGLVWFGRLALKIWHPKWMEYLYGLVVLMYAATMILLSSNSYFVYAYNNSDNFYAFRSDLTVVSDYINHQPANKGHTYLVLDLFSLQTVDYLTSQTGNQYIVVDPENSPKLHVQPDDKIIFTQSTIYDSLNFEKSHPGFVLDQLDTNKFGEVIMKVYHVTKPARSQSLAANSDLSFLAINFGNRIDFAWDNLSFDPWKIVIYQCDNSACTSPREIKEDNQNDYFSTRDFVLIDGTKKDLFFKAIGFDSKGAILKDFGTIIVSRYK